LDSISKKKNLKYFKRFLKFSIFSIPENSIICAEAAKALLGDALSGVLC
jgi:hypothetical protein